MNNIINSIPSSSLGVGRDKKEFRQGTFNTKRKDSATAEGFAIIDICNNFFNEKILLRRKVLQSSIFVIIFLMLI